MIIYLDEVVNIHESALSLTDTESSLLYNIIFDITCDYHSFDNSNNAIFVTSDIFFYIYPIIMFKFMSVLLDLKSA